MRTMSIYQEKKLPIWADVLLSPVKIAKALTGVAIGIVVLPITFGIVCYLNDEWPWKQLNLKF